MRPSPRYTVLAGGGQTGSTTYLYADCFLVGATAGGAEMLLELEPDRIAIIVWQ
jgi:hypothetical protein